MTVENSELNQSAALPSSNAGLTGGTGDGNRLLVADLERGYTDLDAAASAPLEWMDEFIGGPPARRGFLTRSEGWER